MSIPQQLHDLDKSLWLDNITRGLLTNGFYIEALAGKLQPQGALSFAKSWKDLIACIASKSSALPA